VWLAPRSLNTPPPISSRCVHTHMDSPWNRGSSPPNHKICRTPQAQCDGRVATAHVFHKLAPLRVHLLRDTPHTLSGLTTTHRPPSHAAGSLLLSGEPAVTSIPLNKLSARSSENSLSSSSCASARCVLNRMLHTLRTGFGLAHRLCTRMRAGPSLLGRSPTDNNATRSSLLN